MQLAAAWDLLSPGMSLPDNDHRPPERDWRWPAAAAGLLAGFFDAGLMAYFGVRFEANGYDMLLPVGAYFGVSFAVLGYLLAANFSARRRERHAAAVIERQLKAINAAQARVAQSEKLAALGQLSASIAHEVRNPLAVIRSAAQGIAEGLPPGDAAAQQTCSFIAAEIDRLTSVTSSLLTFARPLHLERRKVPASEIFGRARVLAHDLLAAKGLQLIAETEPHLPLLEVDADLLSQVVLGLVSNAAAAAPPQSNIRLAAHTSAGSVELSVSDGGSGVAPELRARIFEPFFTTRPDGTGLGLAVARQVVEAHGGKIDVHDVEPRGARFVIYLPASPAAALAA